MKDRDYTLATDLAKLRIVISILDTLCPGDDSCVNADELAIVKRFVHRWRANTEQVVSAL